MWCLTNLFTEKVVFVSEGKTTIGRKGSQIELENDASLSRIHAHLILAGDVLKVQDAKSKYGTFLNDKKQDEDKLPPEQEFELNDGDTVKFGKFNNEWIVHKLKYKTVISMLDLPKREKLTGILNAVNVSIANEFDDTCTHLTMPTQTNVSLKLLQALTMCKPVVNPKFWVAFQEAMAKNQSLPKYINYLPKIREDAFIVPNTICLAINENRRKVFNGKTFYFFSNSQMKTYEDIIGSGGGKCVAASKTKVTMTQWCAKNSVVVQLKDNASQTNNEETISKIRAALTSKKRRMIPETEIGSAVLNVSTDLWCNTEQSAVSSLIVRGTPSSSQLRATKSKMLVEDSMQPSELMGPPPPKKRGRPAKVVVQEIVNLDSDDEMEVEGNNKENVPASIEIPQTPPFVELVETQASIGELPETQESFNGQQNRDSDKIDPSIIDGHPETQDSFVSAVSREESIEETKHTQEDRRSMRSSSKSPQKSTASSNLLSNVSVGSSFMSDTDLFNFTSTNSSRNTRKRKNSEAGELSAPSTSKKVQLSAKKARIVDSDSDEETLPPPPVQKAPTKKRAAEKETGGLFAFNTSFAKRLKPTEDSQKLNETTNMPSFIAITPKPVETSVAKKVYDDSDDSCDSGIWLSKAMTSVNINDSMDGTDTVKTEPETSVDTQTFKLSKCSSFFSVCNTSTSESNATTSSMLSKRKHFVKKQNFKPQTCIVSMKMFRVADTIEPNTF